MDDYLDNLQAETLAATPESSAAPAAEPEVVETPAPEANANTGTETEVADAEAPKEPEADADKDEDAESKPKKASGLSRLKARLAAAEAELAAHRSRVTDSGADLSKAVVAEIGAPPQEKDFDGDPFGYERALTAYEVKKVLAEQTVRTRVTEAQARQRAAAAELVEAFEDRKEVVRKAIPDFDKVVSSAKVHVASHVGELILESEKSADLQYYLAKNPEKLAALNEAPPLKAAKLIGAYESRLSLPEPKKATAAPAPVQPVKGAAAPSSPDRDIDAYLAKTYGRRR